MKYLIVMILLFLSCEQAKSITDYTEEALFEEILGEGETLATDSIVKFHFQYEQVLPEAKIIQSTYTGKVPAAITCGSPQNPPIVKDLEKKMENMKIGGKRVYVIPKGENYFKVTVEVVDIISPAMPWDLNNDNIQTTASGLQYIIVEQGSGSPVLSGETVEVDYSGYLTNFTKFDSSVDKGQRYPVVVDQTSVIKGWHEGLKLVNRGGKIRLIIPPELGYGNRGNAVIPANSTLIFDLDVK